MAEDTRQRQSQPAPPRLRARPGPGLWIAAVLFGLLLAGWVVFWVTRLVPVAEAAADLGLPSQIVRLLGGTGRTLVLRVDLDNVPRGQRAALLEQSREVIARRLTAYGAPRALVRSSGAARLLVTLQPETDLDAVGRLATTPGRFDLREQRPDGQWQVAAATGRDGQQEALSGALVEQAQLVLYPDADDGRVRLQLTGEGRLLLAQVAVRNAGQKLALFMDDQMVSLLTAQEPVASGRLWTDTHYSQEEGSLLVSLLSSGPLPTPVAVEGG